MTMNSNTAESILTEAQEQRFIIEDFRPLAESLEWDLGQRYLRERGSKAFLSDTSPVPFVINNDGVLSRQAAELLFTSLVEAEKTGPLEPRIFVLELGIGIGLFARFFLDAFKEMCARQSKDYYRRLTYVAGDRSERMLADACRHGVFANHAGHYLIRVVDAMDPRSYLIGDPAIPGEQPFRAVFLNYLLDCLPAADLKIQGRRGPPALRPHLPGPQSVPGRVHQAQPAGPRPPGPLGQRRRPSLPAGALRAVRIGI